MRPLFRELVAGGAASAFLAALAFGSQLGFVPLLGLAAAVYLGVRWLIPDPAAAQVASGVTRGQLETTVSRIRSKARELEEIAGQLEGVSVVGTQVPGQLRIMSGTVRDLVSHFERDPENLVLASDFLELHLPKALSLIRRYAFLARQPHLDASAREELRGSEDTIALIARAFGQQHGRLLEDDVREFRVDRRVFEELLRIDGRFDLSDEPPPPPPERERT
ncbi:MAG: 5-bromo-4-chloroindolyl phosphate hydrolysis family protein [Holophagales bacterium]|nr:5-bromo-4-chloroindolyl phosphate hydrolysis family protein [Holophagales bacterium]